MADKLLKSITFPDLTDKYIIGDTSLSVAGAGADAKATGDALATKANTDGSYESMTVGNAEQLVSNVRVNDKTPYLFRTSGGSVDIGDREYVNGIVGGTVAFNQLEQNGNFESTTGWSATDANYSVSNNVATFTATAKNGNITSNPVARVAGHRYLMLVDAKGTSAVTMAFLYSWGQESSKNFNITTDWQTFCQIITAVNSAQGNAISVRDTRGSGWDAIYIRNAMLIDLTQMFGSTIADYIYSLEQANAGAGVAWFKKLFPKPYYAYDAGTLKHVEGLVSHDMTGFNQWDEEWEVGSIDSNTGENESSSNHWRTKNYIPVLPNTTYYIYSENAGSNAMRMRYYDADKNFIGIKSGEGVTNVLSNGTVVMPANCYYVRFAPAISTMPSHKACINLSWDGSRDGEYEPYVKHSYPLDSDLTLRGIPKLDANNNLYYDGDVYEADGTVNRKYGIVDLGSLDWAYQDNYTRLTSYGISSIVKAPSDNGALANIVCTKYVNTASNNTAQDAYDKTIGIGTSGVITIKDTAYTDGATFKTAMSGVYLVYELATPTTETADPYQQVQICNDFGTEEYVLDDSAFPVPVGHDTDYPVNLVAKLEMAPNSPSGSGDFIVRQTNGVNEYVPLVIEDALPTIPSATGSYVLTVTVAEGSDPVLAWTQA